MDEVEIFLNLSNPTRLEILQQLNTQKSSTSKLAKNFDMSIPAISLHINKLIQGGLITKGPTEKLQITSLGKAIFEYVPAFQFLAKHHDYFIEHTLEELPSQFICRIGELNNCEFIENTMEAWQKAKDFQLESKEYLYGISNVVAIEFFELLVGLLKKNVKFCAIFGENTIVPKGFFTKIKEIGLEEFMSRGLVNQKMIKKVNIAVILNEEEAMVSFPRRKTNEVNDGVLFVSKDPQFRKWCLDVFNYFWDRGYEFNPARLVER